MSMTNYMVTSINDRLEGESRLLWKFVIGESETFSPPPSKITYIIWNTALKRWESQQSYEPCQWILDGSRLTREWPGVTLHSHGSMKADRLSGVDSPAMIDELISSLDLEYEQIRWRGPGAMQRTIDELIELDWWSTHWSSRHWLQISMGTVSWTSLWMYPMLLRSRIPDWRSGYGSWNILSDKVRNSMKAVWRLVVK